MTSESKHCEDAEARKVSVKEPIKKQGDMSDENLTLEQQLEVCVEEIQDADPGIQEAAVRKMRHVILTRTSSMTSIAKFLQPHRRMLKAYYQTMSDSDPKKYLADILSVLASTMPNVGERESLKYFLLGSERDIGSWGHAYVKNLAEEIQQQHKSEETGIDYMLELVQQIGAFYMKHNAESDAVDFLLKVKHLDLLINGVDNSNFEKACLYLASIRSHLPEPDATSSLDIQYRIYLQFKDYVNALRIALFLDDRMNLREVFTSCDDVPLKKQFCCILARHGIIFMLDAEMCADVHERRSMQSIIDNPMLNSTVVDLARELEVKIPIEDIWKVWLRDSQTSSDDEEGLIILQLLLAIYVNGFINAGSCKNELETLMDSAQLTLSELYPTVRDSAVASLGLMMLWDSDGGNERIKDCIVREGCTVLAGASLGIGTANSRSKSSLPFAKYQLAAYIDINGVQNCAIIGLGLAFAGSQNEIRRKLTPFLADSVIDFSAFAAISLGFIYVGSCNEDVAQAIICALKDRSESELQEDPLTRFFPLALGLLYLGKQRSVEAIAEVSKSLNENIREYCDMTLISCAYAGTGNVQKVQQLMSNCKGENFQRPAVLGIAMVSMAEGMKTDSAVGLLQRLLDFGNRKFRRTVPLALALLYMSNPKDKVIETLSRLSRDSDEGVKWAAIISLGLVGAGTNNPTIATLLQRHSIECMHISHLILTVKLAQGLLHLGKGLLTLNPYHSSCFLLSPTVLAGLTTFLHACLDMEFSICLNYLPIVVHFLALAMQPRILMTMDEDLNPRPVLVRVGEAVHHVAGKPGTPMTITNARTCSTPVLLAVGERAELATNKYIPLSRIMEGFVILRENPEHVENG